MGLIAAPPDGLLFVRVSDSFAVGVGSQQEESVTEVRGADGCRGYTIPFRIPPARGQVGEDVGKPSAKQPWDVLHEQVSASHAASDPPYLGPEPSLVGLRESFAGDADGLTWESRSNEIHRSTPRHRIEGA
jgi:hypothetical protein